MRYPFSPAILDAMPEELADLYRALEDQLLVEICSRLAIKDQLNEVTVQAIRALRAQGIPLDEIKKAIRQTTKISEQKLDQLLDDVVERNQTYYTGMIDLAQITQPDILVDAMTIDAIKRQTLDACRNITASMGFLVDNGRRMLPPAEAYQWALDNALMQVDSGVISYNQAITNSIKQLADSGLKTVSYETGHVDQIDVAARRAVMTGVSQLNSRYAEQSMEYIETDLVETEAHAGARDIDGPKGWENHKAWQGKVYRWREYTLKYPGTSKGDYPDFAERCGIGDVQGIEGANCRHTWFPFVEGVSERTWTDEQLAHIDDKLGCTYDGRTYSAYEATQMQRRLEREIRKQKRRKKALEAYGLSDDKKAANARLIRLNKKYREFSKTAGLPEQRERVKVSYVDDKSLAEAGKLKDQRAKELAIKEQAEAAAREKEALQNAENIGKLKEKIASGELSTKIRTQVQARHIEGTPEFEKYKASRLEKGQTPQSILSIADGTPQEIVDNCIGTGTVVIKERKDGSYEIKEYTDADRVIGKYYADDAYHETKRIVIIYAKKGTHIVPTNPEEKIK